MQDSNPGGQAPVAVRPARPQRPVKAPAPLAEKVKVGQIFRLRLFQGQDRKMKTPKLKKTRGQVGNFGILIRVQTVAAERPRRQAREISHGKTPLRGLVGRPEPRRESQSEKPVAAVRH